MNNTIFKTCGNVASRRTTYNNVVQQKSEIFRSFQGQNIAVSLSMSLKVFNKRTKGHEKFQFTLHVSQSMNVISRSKVKVYKTSLGKTCVITNEQKRLPPSNLIEMLSSIMAQ